MWDIITCWSDYLYMLYRQFHITTGCWWFIPWKDQLMGQLPVERTSIDCFCQVGLDYAGLELVSNLSTAALLLVLGHLCQNVDDLIWCGVITEQILWAELGSWRSLLTFFHSRRFRRRYLNFVPVSTSSENIKCPALRGTMGGGSAKHEDSLALYHLYFQAYFWGAYYSSAQVDQVMYEQLTTCCDAFIWQRCRSNYPNYPGAFPHW